MVRCGMQHRFPKRLVSVYICLLMTLIDSQQERNVELDTSKIVLYAQLH